MNRRRFLCFFFGICSTLISSTAGLQSLETIFEWSQLEFDYPSEQQREDDISEGHFIPGKPASIDVDVYYGGTKAKNKVFVTIPRFQEGLPVALGIVSREKRNGNPIIKPYPSWDWHRHPKSCNPDRIVSVYRVMIDECDRLWVLDTGRYINEIVCSPQILAFDMKTDQLIHRYEIPKDRIEPRSILVTPVVDIRGVCDQTFVYVADCTANSIIVYDVQKGTSWKVTDKTMYPYPNYGTFTISGESFDLMDGVLGMALEPYIPGQDRKLFFHAMSSPTENWVYTSHLRNHSLIAEHPPSLPQIFHTYKGSRGTQSAAEAIDRDGVMYFGLMKDIKIACFYTRGEYGDKSSSDVVADDKQKLQFASGVKVISKETGGQELWVMTSRFQKIATGSLNPHETNFRILAGKIDNLLQDSKCKSRPTSGGYGYGYH